MKRLAGGVALAALLSAGASAVYAQETTGGVRGQVTDQTGSPVGGATVTVTHTPTGSTTTQLTGPDGFYSARGLRVGGPYRVAVSAPDSQGSATTIGAIGVGEALTIDLTVDSDSALVDELVITAAQSAGPTGGPSTNLTSADIESLPSVSRDLKDLVRLDPFVSLDPTNENALSFAGANTRFNQLTVDGIRQNDDFGLNGNGYPTQRSPISLEAIEAVSASAAPYSAINNGFVGGQINAVTKSGSNRFSGSAYYERSGRDFQGDSIRGAKAGAEFKEEVYGVTLGGPIIPDRLYFFGAYEKFEGILGFDEGPVDAGTSVSIPRITTAAVDTFQAAVQSVYGYDAGSYLSGSFPVEDEKWFGKLDWDINNDHRLTLAYQKTTGNSLNGSVNTVFAGGNLVTQPRIGLLSNQYDKIEELTGYRGQLNSQWTENFSTELRYSFKEQETVQAPLGGLTVGEVTVTVTDLPGVLPGAGTPQIRFGADLFRHDNYLDVKVDTYEALGRYSWGPHDFLFGARTEKSDIVNVFVASSLGAYNFASYADFLARRASSFSLTGGVDPNAGTVPATLGTARLGAGAFSYRLSSVYAEDRLQVIDDLDISAGVRMDWYSMDDKPTYNSAFVSRHGFSNQSNLDGKSIVLPRVAFNWTPRSDLKVSGGLGRFSATGLNVWVSNSFSVNGVNQTNATCPAGPYTSVVLTQAPAGCVFTPRGGNTNTIDPSLRIPSAWKANLTVAYNFDAGVLGDNWLVQFDYLKVWNENSLYWRDLRAMQIGTAPDGRPVYARTTTGETTGNEHDLMLTNGDGGGADVWAFGLGKAWNQGWLDGLSAKFIYTNTRAEDINPMTSSQAFSSYTRFATSNPNDPEVSRSDYEVRERISIDVSYQRKFFGDNKTSIRVFAQNRTGLPFSYTFAGSRTGNFDNDFGYAASSYSGRQATSNALLYVPATANGAVTATSDPRVTYAPGFNVAAFNSYLESSGLLAYAGGIAPRNAFRNPDLTTVDIRLAQELPAFFPGGAKLEVFLDVENFGNLLNDKWGVLEQYDFTKNVPVVNVTCGSTAGACAAPGATYTYSGTGQGGAFTTPISPFLVPATSLWLVKVGVKYKF